MNRILFLAVLLLSPIAGSAPSSSIVEDVKKAEVVETFSAPTSLEEQTASAVLPVMTEAEPVISSDKKENLKESEIPVLAVVKNKKEASQNPYLRMFLSLIVIAVLATGLVYFSKWYTRTHQKSADTNRIRVLTQHFLGPRKSLAIVRVAGETILIGVTDQNISMLKTLSLLDEELPEIMSGNFKSKLSAADERAQKAEAVKPENEAEDFIIGSIKDKISTKIKGMRNL